MLGMPAPCVTLIAQRTLGQMRQLAEAHPEWLRPRWMSQPRVWRELLTAARTDDAPALWRARLRGQTLLAAETRNAGPERPRRVPGANAPALAIPPPRAPEKPRPGLC
jgi:hypothetical protein